MRFFNIFQKKRKSQEPLPVNRRPLWVIIALLIVVGYLIFIFSRSMWRSFEINRELLSLQTRIENLKVEQLYLKNLIAYYGTKSYAEKEARSKLGLKKEGEIVLALPRKGELEDKKELIEEEVETQKMSNPEKWWRFFFKL